ncbi:hypothetical protein SmJEL517_g03790 [Synchytrium microbalum]|uniref:CMP/dCMP-type deaminase domain-containing protein n=1 Tax=Synchytrium microbalum TaxID=1806994 RepID=A0A507C5A6_9FUNG|nr:uncharacterized protein SmJEL517_g03790 [Synchytrium microbalum]TPX33294.1 hypothetical protein SmJEL517_g03790 [Synchytrium microbalum]
MADNGLDKHYMNLAIIQAHKCIPSVGAFNVGAILVSDDNTTIIHAHSRELPGNTHAEECCFLKLLANTTSDTLAAESLPSPSTTGATIYSTMEPCGERLSGKMPCADLIIKARIRRVVIGASEPPNFISQTVGEAKLKEAGIVYDVMPEFREACLAPNKHLTTQ